MPAQDDNLLQRLLATFTVEAQEHIQVIASGLVELEQAATAEARVGILETTFRAAHSLKGAARTVNVTDIEALCQSLESVFATLKRREVTPSPDLFDLLHQVVGALGILLKLIDAEPTAVAKPSVTGLIESLQAALTHNLSSRPRELLREAVEVPVVAPAEVARPSSQEKRGLADTVRVSTTKLDAVLRQAEELLSAKLAATQHATQLRQLQVHLTAWKKKWAKLQPHVRPIRQALESERTGGLPTSP